MLFASLEHEIDGDALAYARPHPDVLHDLEAVVPLTLTSAVAIHLRRAGPRLPCLQHQPVRPDRELHQERQRRIGIRVLRYEESTVRHDPSIDDPLTVWSTGTRDIDGNPDPTGIDRAETIGRPVDIDVDETSALTGPRCSRSRRVSDPPRAGNARSAIAADSASACTSDSASDCDSSDRGGPTRSRDSIESRRSGQVIPARPLGTQERLVDRGCFASPDAEQNVVIVE